MGDRQDSYCFASHRPQEMNLETQAGRELRSAGYLLTTALGEKAATPETRARERKSFMVLIKLYLGCVRE
jgi:hypothetical protein